MTNEPFAITIKTPELSLQERQALLLSLEFIKNGGTVYCAATYRKQTDTPPRIAGQDYVSLPGIDMKSQMGRLRVKYYTDNHQNRKLDRVGKPYLTIQSFTRADGVSPTKPTTLRAEGLTGFAIQGFKAPGQ